MCRERNKDPANKGRQPKQKIIKARGKGVGGGRRNRVQIEARGGGGRWRGEGGGGRFEVCRSTDSSTNERGSAVWWVPRLCLGIENGIQTKHMTSTNSSKPFSGYGCIGGAEAVVCTHLGVRLDVRPQSTKGRGGRLLLLLLPPSPLDFAILALEVLSQVIVAYQVQQK